LQVTTAAATVRIGSSVIEVGPGQTETVSITFSPPQGVNPSALPVFSGFIQVTSASENLHVPYLGVAAAMKDVQVFDNTIFALGVNLPTILSGATGDVQEGPQNYTFVNDDFPLVFYSYVFFQSIYAFDVLIIIPFEDSLRALQLSSLTLSRQTSRLLLHCHRVSVVWCSRPGGGGLVSTSRPTVHHLGKFQPSAHSQSSTTKFGTPAEAPGPSNFPRRFPSQMGRSFR
jgi:hypothetical protein